MKFAHLATTIAATAVFASAPAQAATITFADLPVTGPFNGNGAAFTTYSENGFTVSAPAGQYVDDTSQIANPSIRTGSNNGTLNALLTLTGTGLFTFGSFDAYASGTPAAYTLTGFLNGSQVYSSSGTVGVTIPNGTFSTFSGFSNAAVDRVTIGTVGVYVLDIDNITTGTVAVAAVPEPATWLTMILGFGLVGFAVRQRRQTAVRFA